MSLLLPTYTHIVNPRLKHAYLSFDETGRLVVKSPGLSTKEIEQILLKRAGWIEKARKRVVEKKGRMPNFSTGSTLYFLGTALPLQLEQWEKKRTLLTHHTSHFLLQYHTFDVAHFEKLVNAFYKQEAQTYLPPLIEAWAQKMQVDYQNIQFRKTKRQWGSCSASNRLSFNTMLMKLPQHLIEYVIVHELTHITHKHHQRPFWQAVARVMPDYQARVEALKTYTP